MLDLHISSKINDGIEDVWVTSDEVVILLCIDVKSAAVEGFSCRLPKGLVAELGWSVDSETNSRYPNLLVFLEGENREVTDRSYFSKHEGEWHVSY